MSAQLNRRSRSFNTELSSRKSCSTQSRRKSLFGISTSLRRDTSPTTPTKSFDDAFERDDIFHSGLLDNKIYHEKFRDFCVKEHSEENVSLMDTIKRWRALDTHEQRLESLKNIATTLHSIVKNLMDSHQRFIKSPAYKEIFLEEARLFRSTSSISIMNSIGRRSWKITSSSKTDVAAAIPKLDVTNVEQVKAQDSPTKSKPLLKMKSNLSLPTSTSTTPSCSPRSPTHTPRKTMSSFVNGLLSLVKSKKRRDSCATDLSYRDETYDDKTL
ncbi:RGS14 [Acrasis kona]|uniref:RGS14 n=1 Tax=Acrasis kona TaxID=1008807 RepID=A0AAW2Z633_9EUKA